MSGILQSGSITPNHLAKFITDNVIGDAGPVPSAQRVLASLTSADFDITTDQPIMLPTEINSFQLTGIIIANASTALNVATGGFYPAASKGGSALVSAAQVYTSLTTSLLLMNATLTAYAQAQLFSRSQLADWAIYFALSAAQGVPCTADIHITGIILS